MLLNVIEKNYTIMDNAVLNDKNLGLSAKAIMYALSSLPKDWSFSIKGLETITGSGSYAIRSALKELMDESYLKIVRTRNNGRYAKSKVYLRQNKNDEFTEVFC